MGLDYINKNKELSKKIQEVHNLSNEKKYTQAYKEIAKLIEYINKKFIEKNYNVKLKYGGPLEASKIYMNKDEKLFNDMVYLNGEYNLSSEYEIELEDVDYLMSILETIYNYMITNYGEFI